jgi:CubicO group peptidase (beta-lactamase class C family)
MLTHMSGLTAGFAYAHPVDELYRRQGLGGVVDGKLTRTEGTLEEGIDRLAGIPLLFSPGTGWSYGSSTDVCGRIIEVVSGQPLDQFFKERIFEPLGMDDTGFAVTPEKVDRFCAMYGRNRHKELVKIDSATNSTYITGEEFLSGAGGLVSTAADYERFTQMLLRGGELEGTRVIGRKTLSYMTLNHLPGAKLLNDMGQGTFSEAAMEGTGFGLGFSVAVDPAAGQAVTSVGEFAWGGAASTTFWVDPLEELVVLFFTQLMPSNTFPIRRQLKATVYQALID